MTSLRLVYFLSICAIFTITRVAGGVSRQRGYYKNMPIVWPDDDQLSSNDDNDDGDVIKFRRVARMPTDFSFNSDLSLLRKMISESRPHGQRLLAFGK